MSIFLVTGGAGFIGSHLVCELLKHDRQVRVVDNFSTGKRENIESVMDRIKLFEGDIRDLDFCCQALKGVSVVFHQAAIPSVPRSLEDPLGSHQVNVDGTFNVLLAAHRAGVKRFIYAASSSAYGDAPTSPKHEAMPPNPKSPYAVNKLVGEYYCGAFYQCFGLQTISLRYFDIFGPRQDPKSQYSAAVPAFVTAILDDKAPTVFGDGDQSRDFTYVDNVVQANLLAAAAPRTSGQVINIACGKAVTINGMIEMINRILDKNIESVHTDPLAGDVKHSLADISLARELIGYEPDVQFEQGLKKAIDWYIQNADAWRAGNP